MDDAHVRVFAKGETNIYIYIKIFNLERIPKFRRSQFYNFRTLNYVFNVDLNQIIHQFMV